MTIKSVIGHDSPQIRMSNEEYAEKVVYFSLIPIRSIIQIAYARNRGGFVGICLDSYARIVPDAEHVVDHFEALVLGRIVDSGDITDLGELCSSVILEEGEHGDDARWWDVDGQFVFPDGKLLDIFRQAGRQILSIFVESLSLLIVSFGRIDDWRFELALRMISWCKP